MVLQAGEKVGAYRVENEIGSGGMATVFKAYHDKLDRHVALKLMHRNLLQDDNFKARFAREAKIVARLEHPNIVPIYDFDTHEGLPYLVMRYINGPTLKRLAIKQGMTIDDTIAILRELANAIDYAHDNGILHRDLKPSNILIESATGRPYVTDFGLARIAQAGESTISHDLMLGTPFYISPEQAQGQNDLTKQTDLYSFGVILYELITGVVPFTADTPYAIVHGHIYKHPEPPSDINPSLTLAVDEVVLRALSKNPEKRYSSATVMMNAFADAVESSVVDKPPVDVREIPPPQAVPPSADERPVIQAPQREVTVDEKGRRLQVEGSLDLGNLTFKDFGKRVENGVESLRSMIDEGIDSDIERRGGYKPEYDDYESAAAEARYRVRKRLKAKQELTTHLIIYAIINTMLFGIWLFTSGPGSFPWPFIALLAWGAGVVGQWYEYRSEYGAGAQQFEAEVEREMERMGVSDAAPLKGKNAEENLRLDDEALDVRLNEDGELTDSFVEEASRKR